MRSSLPCEECGAWGLPLFSVPTNDDGGQQQFKGSCPYCYTPESDWGNLHPIPDSVLLGAKDLPTTILSDHLEQRLSNKLDKERQDRATQQGKTYDEVLGVEALVVRVVSSVDKTLLVEQQFLKIFCKEKYPVEFPYKSKVVLLFQKIEGIEVCLFGMYVQEYGSECPFPNQRRVYLSFVDFVEYFQPKVKAVNGEPLSTVVYHEIIIGYLEYCKKRGFTSCYIWACPPLTGEDYILKRHDPEIQRRPKSDKLREWYLAMLRKAAKEQIVVETTNLFDHFFVSTSECKAKVTAVRLPYFDGDYWPGAAEDLINQLREEDARNQSANASEDHLLMRKLGETIIPMKEDFIMVHLQHYCNHCAIPVVSGNRWVCNQCKHFQICDECYAVELKREKIDRHPVNHIDKHTLFPFPITDVPVDTKDQDEILESEFFDEREVLLRQCRSDNYQYDTLRQAKCSSMMIVYYLHNPTQPLCLAVCSICHLDIEIDEGWHCETCMDYVVCHLCYHKDMVVDPPHKLANNLWEACRYAQNTEARKQRVIKHRRTLDLVVHTSVCYIQCGFLEDSGLLEGCFPECLQVKRYLRHGMTCKTRAGGGCNDCTRLWRLLRFHAQACRDSQCHAARCQDLRALQLKWHREFNSRRREAVKENMMMMMMMTQPAAEEEEEEEEAAGA